MGFCIKCTLQKKLDPKQVNAIHPMMCVGWTGENWSVLHPAKIYPTKTEAQKELAILKKKNKNKDLTYKFELVRVEA